MLAYLRNGEAAVRYAMRPHVAELSQAGNTGGVLFHLPRVKSGKSTDTPFASAERSEWGETASRWRVVHIRVGLAAVLQRLQQAQPIRRRVFFGMCRKRAAHRI